MSSRVIDVILAAAKSRGITRKRIAEHLGLHANRITAWDDGTGEPSFSQTLRLATMVGISLDDIARRMGEKPPMASQEAQIWHDMAFGPDGPGLTRAMRLLWLGVRAEAEGWHPKSDTPADSLKDETPREAPYIGGAVSRGEVIAPKKRRKPSP